MHVAHGWKAQVVELVCFAVGFEGIALLADGVEVGRGNVIAAAFLRAAEEVLIGVFCRPGVVPLMGLVDFVADFEKADIEWLIETVRCPQCTPMRIGRPIEILDEVCRILSRTGTEVDRDGKLSTNALTKSSYFGQGNRPVPCYPAPGLNPHVLFPIVGIGVVAAGKADDFDAHSSCSTDKCRVVYGFIRRTRFVGEVGAKDPPIDYRPQCRGTNRDVYSVLSKEGDGGAQTPRQPFHTEKNPSNALKGRRMHIAVFDREDNTSWIPWGEKGLTDGYKMVRL